MKKEVQAGQIFKYYGLPKWKAVELCGMLKTQDYQGGDNQEERQSCNKT